MTYRLTGRYPLGDLSGRPGARLRLSPSTTIVGDDNIVLPAPVWVELDADGAFAVDLIGVDDPAYGPSGWVWTVTEKMDGGRAPWSFELTADADLSELAATVPPDEYETLVPTSRAIVAGAGLTGGGALTADRTLDVGAGTGITVAADVVAVDTGVIATRAYADGVGTEADALSRRDRRLEHPGDVLVRRPGQRPDDPDRGKQGRRSRYGWHLRGL